MNLCKVCSIEIKPKRIYCSNACKFSDKEYLKNKASSRKKEKMHKSFKCPECDWSTNDINNKSGAFSKHIRQFHGNINDFCQRFPELKDKFGGRQLTEESSEYIRCMECNMMMKVLTYTHLKIHGLTPASYKKKYQIDSTHSRITQAKTSSQQLDLLYSKIQEGNRVFGYVPKFTREEFFGVSNNRKYPFQCGKCSQSFESTLDDGKMPKCPICDINPSTPTGKAQQEIFEFLSQWTSVIKNDRTILTPKEIDLYLPEYQIGIEYNGNHWHSDRFITDKNYHVNKTILAETKGVRLIHIFEDEWKYKPDIVKRKLQHILKKTDGKVIHARKCDIREISHDIAANFTSLYHIQGHVNSSVQYGAFYEDKLVACATFIKSRGIYSPQENEYELLRFVTLPNHKINGIFSRIVKVFQKQFPGMTITTFADYRWTQKSHNIYTRAGFTFCGITKPNYWYIAPSNSKRLHRYGFRKQILVSQGHDSTLTEREIMENMGYEVLWDCGNLKFQLNPSA